MARKRQVQTHTSPAIKLLLIWISPIKVREIFTFHHVLVPNRNVGAGHWLKTLVQRMPKGRAFIDMVSPWQKKLWVDLAPATLTSISTMATYGCSQPDRDRAVHQPVGR